jgi:hypothetical protein
LISPWTCSTSRGLFLCRLPQGKRISIMTLGGGWGVITADLCVRYGLSIATLTPDLIARFDKILPSYWSKSNPVDIVGESDNNLMTTIMEELLKWDGCDALINLGVLGRSISFEGMAAAVERADPSYSRNFLEQAKPTCAPSKEHLVGGGLMDTYNKPVQALRKEEPDGLAWMLRVQTGVLPVMGVRSRPARIMSITDSSASQLIHLCIQLLPGSAA